jgi:cytochrome c-type biogenesis protein CcmH
MRKLRLSLVAGALALAALAQTSSGILTVDGRRVGAKLACLCGTCKNTVGDCPMLQCHYSSPAREKITAMQAEGKDDQSIIDAFVKESGVQALAVPPTEGFSLLAWTMPFVAVAFGLAAIWMVIRRYRRPAPVAEVSSELLERYHDQIEKEITKLD